MKVPVTLFLVTMSTIAYLERHPPTLPNKRFSQQRAGLVIEPIFDDGAVDAPMAILAEPPLWRTWPHKTVVRAPGRHCAWARFTPPHTPGMQQPVNSSMICLRNETDLLCDEVRRVGYWPECADLPGLYTRAVATLAAEIHRRPRVAFPSGPLLFVDAGATNPHPNPNPGPNTSPNHNSNPCSSRTQAPTWVRARCTCCWRRVPRWSPSSRTRTQQQDQHGCFVSRQRIAVDYRLRFANT